jgi:hypothetical protein
MSDRLSDYTEMIRDFHEDKRRKRVSNSQPAYGWYKFFGWAGAIIFSAIVWGFVLGRIFGR